MDGSRTIMFECLENTVEIPKENSHLVWRYQELGSPGQEVQMCGTASDFK